MKRRMLGWIIFSIMLFAIGQETLVFILNASAQREAEAILKEVRTFEVGRSNGADVDNVVRRYGGGESAHIGGICPEASRTESISVVPKIANLLGWRIPRLFGNRVWLMEAQFVIDHDKVCYLSYTIRTYLVNGPGQLLASATSGAGASEAQYNVVAGSIRNVDRLTTTTPSNATDKDRWRAFDFDFSCLTRLAGCRSTCELMPSAWLDYQKEAHARGWVLPTADVNDPRCKKIQSHE